MPQIRFWGEEGSAPDISGGSGGAHSAPPDLLARFKGFTSKGMGGQGRDGHGRRRGRKGRKWGRKGREKGREDEGREGEGCVMAFGGMDAPGLWSSKSN